MKLSPYVLVRIGGLPFKTMVDLSWSNKEYLEDFLKNQSQWPLKTNTTNINHSFMVKLAFSLISKFIFGERFRVSFNMHSFSIHIALS